MVEQKEEKRKQRLA